MVITKFSVPRWVPACVFCILLQCFVVIGSTNCCFSKMNYYLVLVIVFILAYCIFIDLFPKNYPPGPIRFPVIGSWLSFPVRGIEKIIPSWRKKYGSVIGLKLFGKNIIFVAGYKETLCGLWNNNFQGRLPTLNPILRAITPKILGLVVAEDEQWKEIRKFSLRYLTQIPVTIFELAVHNEMMDLFAKIKSGEMVDVDNKFFNFPTYIVSAITMGDVKKRYAKEIDIIREDTDRAFKGGRPTGIENFIFYLRGLIIGGFTKEMVVFGEQVFQKIIDEHRASFDENNIRDYIDDFLLRQKNERESTGTDYYSDKELLACLNDIVRTSGESTANTAIFLLLYTALYPEVQRKMHDELDKVLGGRIPKLADRNSLLYTEAVIYETTRINSIAPISVGHVATETTQFYGYTIPKDSYIIFSLRDILMDPKLFDEPKEFKPERFLDKKIKSKLIAFGLGKRSCIGKVISKNILFLFTAYFFQKYSISLPEGCQKPSTDPELGLTNSAQPFKIIIRERCC